MVIEIYINLVYINMYKILERKLIRMREKMEENRKKMDIIKENFNVKIRKSRMDK
jgi:hypothetical protein